MPSEASAEYDVFVNSTYRSTAVNHSPRRVVLRALPAAPPTRREPLDAPRRRRRRSGPCRYRRGCPSASASPRPARGVVLHASSHPELPPLPRQLPFTATWVGRLWDVAPRSSTRPCAPAVGARTKRSLILNVGRFFDPRYGHSKKQLELIDAFNSACAQGRGGSPWREAVTPPTGSTH